MFIVQLTNDSTFPSGEGFVGPFSTETTARGWAKDNVPEGAEFRIIGLVDIFEATLTN